MRRFDRSSSNGRYSNPCLTMHQPWASLLVHGIKRVEGRSWPSPITGRMWIHAASKVPDPDTIRAMEDFYREIYAVNGITDIKFPDHYPVSRLLGCVEVVGCVRSQELVCWENVPESVRLEGLTDFCWLCENPQRLVVPFEMRGYQGVYNLERRIYDGAVRGLTPVQGPQPVTFPLPDPRDPFSLKPGSLTFDPSKSALQKTASVTAAIAGARAAATQYSRKDHNAATSSKTQQFSGDRVDSSLDYGSLTHISQGSPSSTAQGTRSSIAQASPSYLQNQNQPSISRDSHSSMTQGSPSYPQNQNQISISLDSHSSIDQRSPSYLQNQNQPSISRDSRSSITQGSPYPQNQNQLSISLDSRLSIDQRSPSYLQKQNHPSISRDSSSSIPQGSPSYLQSHIQPSISQHSRSSIAQGSPSYLQNQNQPPIPQRTPAYSRNLNTGTQRSPRVQNGAPNRLLAVALRELKLSSDSERRQSSVPRSWPGQNS